MNPSTINNFSNSSSQSLEINLGENGTKSFSSLDEFRQWIDKERSFWTPLFNLSRNDSSFNSALENRLSKFFHGISRSLQNTTQSDRDNEHIIKSIKSYISDAITSRSIVFSGTREGHYISSLLKEKPNIAAHVAGAFLNLPLNPNIPESVEGHFLSIAFKNGFQDSSRQEREALGSLKSEWSSLLSESKTDNKAFAAQNADLINQHVKQIEEQRASFREISDAASSSFHKLLDKSEKELTNIAQTYDKKLAVHASVVYWKNKAITHEKAAKSLSWWCAIVGIVVALFLGAEVFLYIGPLQKIGDMPIWKGAFLFLTAIIGVWALRILVRLLLSNLHLRADAIERRTMLLTYLALLRRGQGPNENQRELLLQILFRPSATGIVKDDALPPIVAQWLNTVTNT